MGENESKSKCNITKAEFCPAEVLFPGQTDGITKFLRYYDFDRLNHCWKVRQWKKVTRVNELMWHLLTRVTLCVSG